MLIEIVWSFLHKTLATIHLTLQTMSLSGLKWRCSPLLPCINVNEARGHDLSHCDKLNLDEKYNCQRLKHVKFL